ncbi:hypothetical protein O181_082207 [Austropuccinia psidii MF-1]|uniref:Uncharacterized protein n=1 Tax=Austropuccinia psidii MF-1 TaxID=1389203 RepID=A0A9Q3FS42_9BASI|nr:hypothetical protein [Austropuccinia psidii MF-1]
MFHEDLFDFLSADIKGAISKEMIKENVMVRAEDGGYLIPPMKILKKYIEQELEVRILVTKGLSPPRISEQKESKNKERSVQFKEEVFLGMKEAFKKMKELKKTLKEQREVVKDEEPAENEDVKKFMEQLNELTNVATPQKKIINNPQSNNQGFIPRDNVSSPPKTSVPYVPAQNVPKFTVKCYYCMEEGHSVGRCTELVDDQNKKWVIRQVFNYLYPNWERVPKDGKFPPKYLVREFQREQEELKRNSEEKNKEEEQNKKEKSTAFISMDNWGDWEPPCISTGSEEPLGYAYGLRNTKQRIENKEKFRAQPLPSKETIKPKDTRKKKTSIPGGFIEEEEVEEEKVIIPTKYKSSKAEEVVRPPEPSQPKPTAPAKEKDNDKEALIKLPNMEVNKKPLIE